MNKALKTLWLASLLLSTFMLSEKCHAENDSKISVEKTVAQTIQPLMKKLGIPGMAVGIVLNRESFIYEYGISSKTTKQLVTSQTLFEIGSISRARIIQLMKE